MKNTAVLLIVCPDRKGIVAAVAEFLYKLDANILHADQHQDAETELFLMRVEWDLAGFALDLAEFSRRFSPLADRFDMRWRLEDSRNPLRVAAVRVEVRSLPDGPAVSTPHGRIAVPYPADRRQPSGRGEMGHVLQRAVPHDPDPTRREEAFEQKQLELLAAEKIDLVVMARYMQILSKEFISRYPHRIINVHHSFLPAFTGASPTTGHSSAG